MVARLAFGLIAFASLVGIAVACSDDPTNPDDIAIPDGGLITIGSACPCTVNEVTISCGGAQCIALKGYRCADDGAHEDDTLCVGSTSSSSSGGNGCTSPRTCATAGAQCGEIHDGCGSTADCAACPTGKSCTNLLSTGESGDAIGIETWRCYQTASNVAVFGNIEGGTFTIDIDENVPNLAIGVASKERATVTITGQYAANVVMAYAVGNTASTITGATSTYTSEYPLAYPIVDGGTPGIFCEQQADSGDGDCSPPAQINAFFPTKLGGTLLFNRCQNGAFSGTLKLSDHGTCN